MFNTLTQLIRSHSSGLPRLWTLAAAAVICEAGATLALIPFLIALAAGDSRAWLWLAVLALAVAGTWVFGRRAQSTALDIGFDLLAGIQTTLADRLPRMPVSWLATRSARAVSSLSGIGPDLVGAVGYLYLPLISAFALPPLLGLALLIGGIGAGWGPYLGMAALAGALCTVGAWQAAIAIGKNADKAAERATHAVGERALEVASQQRTLRTCARSGDAGLMAKDVKTEKSATLRLILMQIPAQIVFSLASQASLLAIIVVGAIQWRAGVIEPGAMIALIVIAVRLLEPITQLTTLSATVGRIGSVVADLNELLTSPLTEVGSPSPTPPAVSISHVTHGYGSNDAVVHDCSLEIPAGQTLALVGPSGSGKSTLLHLIAGLETPREGRVLIDGQLAAPGRAAVIFQFPYLFNMSVADNVRAGTDTPIPDDAAETIAFAHDLPAGLDSACGESGSALSGGERQRVSIARALAHPSRLLLIDEATAALDSANQALISQVLARGERTRVIIAHRGQAIAGADRIVVLDGGKIIADGTPRELADHPFVASLMAGTA